MRSTIELGFRGGVAVRAPPAAGGGGCGGSTESAAMPNSPGGECVWVGGGTYESGWKREARRQT